REDQTMMNKSVSVLPTNACAYEAYDPETLEPANESTYIRLLELGWDRELFEGRTVLDIGSNLGILSIYAHKLGARVVHAKEVQQALVEFFSAVVARHKLPIKVEKRGFWNLDP